VDSQQLPSELDALESELRRLRKVACSPSLRDRVLLAVAQELRDERPREWRLYVAAVAAIVVLWANLSWTASRETPSHWSSHSDVTASAERIEVLVPGISRREATRQALLIESGRSLGDAALPPIATQLRTSK
jgi:hypothetical protein